MILDGEATAVSSKSAVCSFTAKITGLVSLDCFTKGKKKAPQVGAFLDLYRYRFAIFVVVW
jgi:hypothetical protein